MDPERHREQVVYGVRGLWGGGPGERRLQLPLTGVIPGIPGVGPMLLWANGGDCGRMGQGKEEDVGGHRVGTEVMGECGQSGYDLPCKTVGLSLRVGCKTKL